MSQRQLADAVGISLGRAHSVLNGLVEAGQVKVGHFSTTEDKRRCTYVLTQQGVAAKTELSGQFLERRHAELATLKREIEALEADLTTSEITAIEY